MPYPTPQANPTGEICRVLRIPNDLTFLMAVDEALSRLGLSSNWEQSDGGLTPDEAAAAMNEMFKNYLDEDCT